MDHEHGNGIHFNTYSSAMKYNPRRHHYSFDAAALLRQCRQSLTFAATCEIPSMTFLEDLLLSIESLLHAYFVNLIDMERQKLHDLCHSSDDDFDDEMLNDVPYSLEESLRVLTLVMNQCDSFNQNQWSNAIHYTPLSTPDFRQMEQLPGDTKEPRMRSVTDSMLFRLIVSLQLCLIRINDVRNVIGQERTDKSNSFKPLIAFSSAVVGIAICTLRPWKSLTLSGSAVAKFSAAAISTGFLYKTLYRSLTLSKLTNSTSALQEWKEHWIRSRVMSRASCEAVTKQLISSARKLSPKLSFWQSEGEMRFLILKRAMDLLYASVGTAIEVTKPNRFVRGGPSWQISLTAMAAASYLTLIGPNKRAIQAINEDSVELIQNAWGMVSLPAIKSLSLRATRILKGAALAERIILGNVPCFILSKDPCPEVQIALKRYERQVRRRRLLLTLSTIEEIDSKGPHHRRSRSNSTIQRQRNVIFHLTGGGFFAHTLASDLPYLLDWSKATGAIVICPEYSLLPENEFPVALEEVTSVYTSLINGSASTQLGFELDRIVLTGESAGGNLAAALCVKLSMSLPSEIEPGCSRNYRSTSGEFAREIDVDQIRLPDALLLSCPALNLSLELSPSRVIGDNDPVLPSGLISAISDAYALTEKHDPLVSPLFASDLCLRHFPRTLLYGSSDDPLLDDAVHFNARLKQVGVESELRATHHMPHAYWGLGTAGFPEAQQVQIECAKFLNSAFKVNASPDDLVCEKS